jgi:23S rRNA (guanosine2251-2'-O)-methyltransferase
VVGIEQDDRALDYKTYRAPKKIVLVLGNEVRGMSFAMRTHCDTLIEIPMRGKKESLNVAVSFGIVAFRLFDR